MNAAPRIVAALAAGLIFGLGLSLSGMLDPTRVRGFLDVTGAWDPSLAFVLGGAVGVAGAGYALARRLPHPAFDTDFELPTKRRIDRPLVAGAALFGIGWGLVGLCPGPALESLATLSPGVIVFVVAMAVGMMAHDAWQQSRLTAQRDRQLAGATDG